MTHDTDWLRKQSISAAKFLLSMPEKALSPLQLHLRDEGAKFLAQQETEADPEGNPTNAAISAPRITTTVEYVVQFWMGSEWVKHHAYDFRSDAIEWCVDFHKKYPNSGRITRPVKITTTTIEEPVFFEREGI